MLNSDKTRQGSAPRSTLKPAGFFFSGVFSKTRPFHKPVDSMDVVALRHRWRPRFGDLLKRHGIGFEGMGCPTDWKQPSIWQEAVR